MFKTSHAVVRFPLFFVVLLFLLFGIQACKNRRIERTQTLDIGSFPELFSEEPEIPVPYKGVPTRVTRLIHTRLNVEPVFENSTLKGEAGISMVPHFYRTDSVILDAVNFDIQEVKVSKGAKAFKIKYDYDGKKLRIKLGEEISRKDTIFCEIKYVAKPEEGESKMNNAIVSEKGLFFINPSGKEPFKPKQVWTQGETSYNSRWFPTIESPDQRMTQEVSITVPQEMVTLSNGLLVNTVSLDGGKRKDTWVQKKSAAPYLTMIAAGRFDIVKDKWREMEVAYYVEPAYTRYAKKIFGETPAMIEFFSNRLGVDYPWEKYSQIVVRDYVSGAMENTTATVMGESVQRTDRELIDENAEDIIAHELFHQWFGNLVTCESWANLPLNESFATYAEYLWLEHKYGKDEAEHHRLNDLKTYLNESSQKMVNLFRPQYENEDDMFDAHSYQKGGLILHYLRKLTGDEAFFESLKLYLNRHAFSSVEVPELRMAFEEVTGVDYNWFFNQWFYAAGHPELDISTSWNDTTKTVEISMVQQQETATAGTFVLPIDVHIWIGREKKVHRIVFDKDAQTFTFECKEKPALVSVDPEQWIPCRANFNRSSKDWLLYYDLENSYTARHEALMNLSTMQVDDECRDLVLRAFADPSPAIRYAGINYYSTFMMEHRNAYKNQLIQLATKDEKSYVRAAAIDLLSKHFATESWMIKLNTEASTDRSYLVASTALLRLNEGDQTLAFEMAKRAEADSNVMMMKSIAAIYAQTGSDAENTFFLNCFKRITGFEKYDFISLYSNFLLGRSDSVISQGIEVLLETASQNTMWFIRLAAMNELNEFERMYRNRSREYMLQAGNAKSGEALLKEKAARADQIATDLKSRIREIRNRETDVNLKNIYQE